MPMDPGEQYDRIYRYCYFKLHSRELAEDITQETFLRYLERYRCDSVQEALRCLYTIAGHLCVDAYRKRRDVPLSELSEKRADESLFCSEEAGACEAEQTISRLAVRAALNGLQEEEKELLLLRYVNEVPLQTIAKILGISRFAAYRRIMNASGKLKENLRREGF
mgnify:FL=1